MLGAVTILNKRGTCYGGSSSNEFSNGEIEKLDVLGKTLSAAIVMQNSSSDDQVEHLGLGSGLGLGLGLG